MQCITKNRLPFHLIASLFKKKCMVSGWPTRWSQDTMVLPSHSIRCNIFPHKRRPLGWNFFYEDMVAQHQQCFVGKGKWDTLPRVLYAAQQEPAQLDVEWQRWGSSPTPLRKGGQQKKQTFRKLFSRSAGSTQFLPQRRLRKTVSTNSSWTLKFFIIFWSQRENSPRNSSKRIRR